MAATIKQLETRLKRVEQELAELRKALAAKQKLETLKKHPPNLVSDWLKEKVNISWMPRSFSCNPELRVLRRVGPDRAKLVILFEAFDNKGARAQNCDMMLQL